jgi:hypothetical protein
MILPAGDHPGLDPQRRLWAGVLLAPAVAQAIQRALQGLEMPLRMCIGYPVIHFTDLSGGQGRYKHLKGDARYAPIELFVEMFMRLIPR